MAANVPRGTSSEVSPAILKPIRLVLPYPVSANRYWATMAYFDRETRKPMARTYVTEEAKAYKLEVAWLAKAAGFKAPTTRPIEVGRITLFAPATRLRRDKFMKLVEVKNSVVLNLDNCLKVTFDALNGVVYVDDKQLKRIRGPIEYAEPSGRGGLVIEIGEFIPPPPPLFTIEAV